MSADRIFSVTIMFKEAKLSGLQALDARRRLGLEDGGELTLESGQKTTFIPEDMARLHFCSQELSQRIVVKKEMLKPHHVKPFANRLHGDIFDVTFSEQDALELAAEHWKRQTKGYGDEQTKDRGHDYVDEMANQNSTDITSNPLHAVFDPESIGGKFPGQP